ncbi:centrosome and spindle pole-associated protein 1 isoform X3 [Patella vulgata]|uniref:centrosome and spindle pole-associated protein 1 isoform X3 n=1 Tax=Patella vulgata TaxID=6465 RepID=UPI0024A7D057|nr:centrosome and spindle pole-associated protein 1 isoform X3 [Patella vulgata]
MSSALVDTDIDRFIREQKSKLASEKHDLNEDDNYFKTSRRQWAEPDKENFIIAGSNERDERAETPAHQGYPVDNRQIIKQRKELSDQRKQEYNNYLKTHTDNRRKPKNLTPTQKSIQVGEYDNKIKERLHGQRKKEYNDYLNKAQKKGKTKRGRNFKYHNHNAVLTDRFDQHDYDAVARQHQDENYHDYDLHLQLGSPVEYYETNDVYPDNDTSRVAGLPVGQYEENKKRNAEETKRKYRADLEKQLREKEKIIKRQHGVKSKKISRDEREKQLRIREEMLRKQLRVQGSPRRSIEKRDRKLYQPVQPQRCTCGYNFPRADAEERAYLDFIHLRDKYDFRYQDEYDEWQRRQLAALSEIERRQLELRLKLERDLALHYLQRDAMAHLSDEEKEAIRHCPVHIAKCSPCASRSPSPHIDPPLYDPTEAEILRQSSETPERLLIGETSTEHREKLRQERQREYNDMMAQKRSRARRNILGDDEDSGWGIFGNRSEDDRKLANQRRDDLLINDKKMGTPRTWREPSKEEILLDDKRESYRKKLEEERKNEYNEHLKKTMTNKKTWREPTKEDLFIKDSDDRKRKLQEERNKEYKELVQKKAGIGKRDWREPSKEDLFIKDSNDRKKKLQEERNKEYQELLQQKKAAEKSQDWREPLKEDLLIKDTADRKKKLEEERKKEYQELLEKKNLRPREWREPSKEQLFISDTSDKKKKLQEQRKEEYNQLQKKQTQNRYHDLPPKPGTPGGFLNKLGSHEKQRQKLQEERQKEYNRMQAEKLGLHDFDDHRMLKTKDEEIFATLPGLNYHGSATQRAKARERNEEYNDFKQVFDTPRMGRGEEPPGAPRKGWGTPTYEEMLEKKRNEEQRYRRLNDPDYSRPGLKAYNSEGALHRLEDEKRLKDIEKDISTKKSVLQNGILDDPDWLRSSHEAEHDRTYSRLLERLKNWNDDTQEDDIKKEEPTKETPVNKKASKQDKHLPPHGPAAHAPVYHDYPPRGIKDAPAYLPDANKHRFYASLPVGEGESQKELQKRKDAYKKELERQMQEAEEARKKNRVVEPPQAEVAKQQQPVQPRVIVIPNVQKQPEVIQAAAQQQYQLATGGDRLSPRAEMLLGRTRDLERLERRLKKIEHQQHGISQLDLAELDFMSHRDPRKQMHQPSHGTTGILEQGFDRLLDPPKAVAKPPIGLAYQPSTYVTGGQNFDKFNSIDQVYQYYGAQNPLDIPVAAPAPNYGVAPAVVPSGGVIVDNYRAMGGGGGGGGGGYVSPTMAYNDLRGVGDADPNDGTEAERKAKRAQAQIYQRELERQMEEKKYKKSLEKQERERYERKLEEDIKNYNPYGRGGAGAPMKDAQGNTVADLRALQKGYSPRYDTGYVDPYISPRGVARAASPKDDLIKTPPAQTTALGEATHARGGHGIFGHPKTEAEKTQADRYKEELKRQIDRKKRDAEMEKERERREEEKQSKIVEEQRKKMQEEYDEEKRRIMAKEEEARLRNAEIIKMQEDRKTDEERLKGELEKKKQDEARIDYERERLAREEKRGESPPVPAIKSNNPTDKSEKTDDNKNDKIQTKNDKNEKRTETAPRNNSADVLNQLAHMRRQLQSERKRVENMLEETRNEPDVYDPRLVNRVAVPVQQTQQYQKTDIFETARNRNAVQVRRAPTADHANPSVLQEFDHLKHKADTDSRKQFRKLYPVDPRTQEELESQQAALLRQQEQRLMGYGHSPSDTDTIGINSTSPQAMLHSNSAFIDVEGMDRNLFPDDFDDFPKRNDSARQRRRDRDQGRSDPEIPRNYNPMGSITSLDVDKISRKNEDRLQRLKELQDDVSLYDPDDVLNRFMEKQSHNRPPSNNTLQDDSWLLPGNKKI